MSCPFCDFSKIKKRTIATVDGFHIVASLGQITDGGYLLIIPQYHTPCLGNLDKNQTFKLNSLSYHLSAILEEEYQEPVIIFEHGIVGQTIPHAQLHILPAKINIKSQVERNFPGSKIEAIKDFLALQKKYQETRTPYLLWTTPRNKMMVCWNPPAPPEYLRLLTARLLGVPERGSWRNMDSKLDQALIYQTIEKLNPNFIP